MSRFNRRIDNKTLNNLKHNGNITMQTVKKLCRILKCEIQNIVESIE